MFPFFFWLSYKGWLRADSLEELVGLDVSYHGGMHSVGKAGGVRKEYIDAFNKNRGNLRYRGAKRDNSSSVNEDNDDPDFNQEAAAREAMQEDPIREDDL
jgi:hypothetical protein